SSTSARATGERDASATSTPCTTASRDAGAREPVQAGEPPTQTRARPAATMLVMRCGTASSCREVVSPHGRSSVMSASRRRRILPERVLGSSGTTNTRAGRATGPITLDTWARSSSARRGPASTKSASPVDELRRQLAERTEDLQRLQAEYVNYRKRVDRDRLVARDLTVVAFVEAFLHSHSPEVTESTVSEVLQAGHRAGDRIVRAARVAVVDPEEE